jgi:hypothetical protein
MTAQNKHENLKKQELLEKQKHVQQLDKSPSATSRTAGGEKQKEALAPAKQIEINDQKKEKEWHRKMAIYKKAEARNVLLKAKFVKDLSAKAKNLSEHNAKAALQRNHEENMRFNGDMNAIKQRQYEGRSR